jgi:hypothetical protein
MNIAWPILSLLFLPFSTQSASLVYKSWCDINGGVFTNRQIETSKMTKERLKLYPLPYYTTYSKREVVDVPSCHCVNNPKGKKILYETGKCKGSAQDIFESLSHVNKTLKGKELTCHDGTVLYIQEKRLFSNEQKDAADTFCREFNKENWLRSEFSYEPKKDDIDSIGNDGPEKFTFIGCEKASQWRKNAFKKLCHEGRLKEDYQTKLQDLYPGFKMPKAMLFFFDGFGDYDPKEGKAAGAINTGKHDFHDNLLGDSGNTNGLKIYNKAKSKENHPLNKENIDFFYYHSGVFQNNHGQKGAEACFTQMQRDFNHLKSIYPSLERPKNIIMGYSNGGAVALNFQDNMGDDQFPIDLVIAMDPVPRLLGYVAKAAFDVNSLTNRHPNTKRLISFYQTKDFDSQPGLKIRGDKVSGADENYHISAETDSVLFRSGKYAHVLLPRVDIVQDSILCELSNTLYENSENCKEIVK